MSDINENIVKTLQEHAGMFKSINKKYKQLSKEDLYSCSLFAAYKAIENFNPNKGAKFSSYLYACYVWEIKTLVRNESTYKNRYAQDKYVNPSYETNIAEIDMLIDAEEHGVYDIVNNRIVGKMNYTEIGEKYGVSREKARLDFKEFISKFSV